MPVERTRRRVPKATRPHMPGYGLPKNRKGLLSWNWAEQRLEKSHNYWISTARPDGTPHTMVVWGLWLDGRFYFSTGQKSRKARNLAANPKCVICSDRAEQAVIVEGVAELVSDGAIRKQFGDLYQKKYDWDMKDFAEPVYVVRPRVAFGLFEKKFMGSATRWKFE
jgi:nitroimidazol reductase NimA-like FMN-containing flavoprotein (pyridoxamine 5'-phosphate oxidase superfamily)